MSRQAKKRWKSPEYRQRILDDRASGQSPERKRKHREMMLRLWQDPRFRARMVQARRESWADPAYRAAQQAARESQGYLLQQRARSLKLAQRPDIKDILDRGREKAHAAARARKKA